MVWKRSAVKRAKIKQGKRLQTQAKSARLGYRGENTGGGGRRDEVSRSQKLWPAIAAVTIRSMGVTPPWACSWFEIVYTRLFSPSLGTGLNSMLPLTIYIAHPYYSHPHPLTIHTPITHMSNLDVLPLCLLIRVQKPCDLCNMTNGAGRGVSSVTQFPILLGTKGVEISTCRHCCTIVVTAGKLEGRRG